MNVEGVAELDRRIQAIKLRGTTVLLIEHHMELVMAVSDQIAVLNFGQKIAQGTPAQIQSDTLVKKAYLGGDEQ
jgi:ABC-type branched-subunit amino acid transport system ATPase component